LWSNKRLDGTWHAGRPQPWPHCVRWGPSSPSPKGHSPQFSAHICCGQMAGWINMPLGIDVGLGSRDCVRWGPSCLFPKTGAERPPQLSPMSIVAKQLHESRCDLVRRYSLGQSTLLHGDAATSQKTAHPQFSAYVHCSQTVAYIRIPLGTEVGHGLGDIVLDGEPTPLP